MDHMLSLIEMAAGGLSYHSHEVSSRINRIGAYVSGMVERPDFETTAEDMLLTAETELMEAAGRLRSIREEFAKLPADRSSMCEAAE